LLGGIGVESACKEEKYLSAWFYVSGLFEQSMYGAVERIRKPSYAFTFLASVVPRDEAWGGQIVTFLAYMLLEI
jgi:hypothetical protein